MHIYIDESGAFIVPKIQKTRISCVAALVIPSSKKEEIFIEFENIRHSWSVESDEIKGSKLDEDKIMEVISLLGKYDVIVEICAIDAGTHSVEKVEDFKAYQSDLLMKNITQEHHEDIHVIMNEYRNIMRTISNPLFLQFMTMVEVVDLVLRHSTLYYSLRVPKELEKFHWVVDAKNINITKGEKLWKDLVCPFMQSRSLKNPFVTTGIGDYSYMERFEGEMPDYLKDKIDCDQNDSGLNMRMIMEEEIEFSDSKNNLGVQLVDIIASAFTRAMNGNLQRKGWETLGALIIHRNTQCIRLIRIDNNPRNFETTIATRNYQGYVIEVIENSTKMMLP